MNSKNYWVVSLTAISYKTLERTLKQVTCQLLEIEMAITRNHAKLTLFFFYNVHLKLVGPGKSTGMVVSSDTFTDYMQNCDTNNSTVK